MSTLLPAQRVVSSIDPSSCEPVMRDIRDTSSDSSQEEKFIRERFQRFGLGKLFAVGVEARGIERVPEDEREPKRPIRVCLLWLGFNTVMTVLPVGMLAQASFGLPLAHAVAVIIGFSIIGCTTTAFTSSLGPHLGMRTMIITRYSYGYWGGAVISLVNVLTQLGFSVVSIILAGQILHNVNPDFPLVGGVVIVAVISFLVGFVGYDLLHHFERYAWLVTATIFIIIYILGGHIGYRPSLQNALESPPGRLRAADVLGFGTVVFSLCASLAPMAADYSCRLSPSTPIISINSIFLMTMLGNFIPIVLVITLGAVLMTVPAYAMAYEDSDAAGLLKKVFAPWGKGGDFMLVLLALSVVGNNIPTTYSTALSMQTIVPAFRSLPRIFFTFLAFVIYTVAGISGREHFSVILNNFLGVLGYWIAFWVVIIAEEHFIFRNRAGRLGGYNFNAYDTPSLLPVGIAAIIASLVGIAGAVVAMAQTWYIGPVAATLGPLGGDMGFEFAVVFAGCVYPPVRWWEIARFGR